MNELDKQRWAARMWLCDIWLDSEMPTSMYSRGGRDRYLQYLIQKMNSAWMKLYKVYDGN